MISFFSRGLLPILYAQEAEPLQSGANRKNSTSTGIKHEDVKKILPQFDTYVAKTFEVSGVPGMALAVAFQDQILYLKTFGVRTAGMDDPVDPDTVFQLASYNDFEIHVGRIKYIDYEKEAIPMGNLLSPFVYKRESFEHEDELRALIWTPQHGKNDVVNPQNNKYKDVLGLYVPVDLEQLVEKIYVAPNAPTWILEPIKTVTEKFGLNKEVVQSNLASTPVY